MLQPALIAAAPLVSSPATSLSISLTHTHTLSPYHLTHTLTLLVSFHSRQLPDDRLRIHTNRRREPVLQTTPSTRSSTKRATVNISLYRLYPFDPNYIYWIQGIALWAPNTGVWIWAPSLYVLFLFESTFQVFFFFPSLSESHPNHLSESNTHTRIRITHTDRHRGEKPVRCRRSARPQARREERTHSPQHTLLLNWP
jgi:hypothetical protein